MKKREIRRYIDYFFRVNSIRSLLHSAILRFKHGTKIRQSQIVLGNDAEIIIGKNVIIRSYVIRVESGRLVINDSVILDGKNALHRPSLTIENGMCEIKDHAIIRADINVRFGGSLCIGRYTAINENSEIRCEECIVIGDFCMISYYVRIFDTNTHVIYPSECRRKMTMKDFPNIGLEYEKAITGKIEIGNDCWVGMNTFILKGSILGDENIVGAASVVASLRSSKCSVIVGNPAIVKYVRSQQISTEMMDHPG